MTDMMYLKHDPLSLNTLFREMNLSLAALKVHKSAIARHRKALTQ